MITCQVEITKLKWQCNASTTPSLKISPWSIVIVFISIFLLFVHGQEEAIIIEVCPVPLLLGVPGVALLQPELERGARHLEALARLLVPEEAGVGAVVPGVPARVTLHCTAQHRVSRGTCCQ